MHHRLHDQNRQEVPQGAHDVSSEDSPADRMTKVQAQRLYEKNCLMCVASVQQIECSIDGFCIIVILVMGFVTALGLSPSLYVSAAIPYDVSFDNDSFLLSCSKCT